MIHVERNGPGQTKSVNIREGSPLKNMEQSYPRNTLNIYYAHSMKHHTPSTVFDSYLEFYYYFQNDVAYGTISMEGQNKTLMLCIIQI